MKSNSIAIILSIIAAFVAGTTNISVKAMTQTQDYIRYAGVGPAIAEGVDVDKLPQSARDFIAQHIRECEVSHVDHEFESGSYDVYLSDGVEVNFSSKGSFAQIDAPAGYVLTQSLVRSLVPAKCYKNMLELDCAANVASIEVDGSGYNVSFAGSDLGSASFDMTGKLLAVYE